MDEFDIIDDIADLQENYKSLVRKKMLTKKNMCELVIPFRDKYKLRDSQALQIARDELSLAEIRDLIRSGGTKGE